MDSKVNRWTKGKRTVASLFLATTLLVSVAPVNQAAASQTSTTSVATSQSSTEEVVTPNVIRYEGLNRENVAERVATAHFKESKKVILVNRDKFPDAISATNISQGEYPVLYTRDDRVLDSTMKLLESMSLDEIYVLGGTSSINDSVINQLEEATDAKVSRIDGSNRYVANVNAVEENFTQAKRVIIASGEVYSDALYGVSYANTIDAPVVLTKGNQLPASTVELLKDLDAESVTIIGGEVTVTKAVEDQLTKMGIKYDRIAGQNRYIGSAEVASASYDNPENIVVASGEVFSDALVSAPLAQKLNAPILLVRKNRMENKVESYLTSSRIGLENIYIQGGPLTISPTTTETRIKGLTTYTKTTNIVPVRTVTESYEEVEEEDDTLPEGETKVTQEGKDGYQILYYEVVYINGQETSRVEVNRETVEAVPEITKIGTKIVEEETDEDVNGDTVTDDIDEEEETSADDE